MQITHKSICDLRPGDVVLREQAFVVGAVKPGGFAPKTHTRVFDDRGAIQSDCRNEYQMTVVRATSHAALLAACEVCVSAINEIVRLDQRQDRSAISYRRDRPGERGRRGK